MKKQVYRLSGRSFYCRNFDNTQINFQTFYFQTESQFFCDANFIIETT